jgi:hypothetical protein
MATLLKYRLVGDPALQFRIALEQFAGPELDNIHKQVAIQLTTQAKAILEDSKLRPWESGNRTGFRLTGTITGKYGRKAALQSRILNPGPAKQAKGVGFPDIALLDRKAKHWRGLEYGWPFMTMPAGLFLQDGKPQPRRGRTAGDQFFTYGEFATRERVFGRAKKAPPGPLGPRKLRRVESKKGTRTRREGGRGTFGRSQRVEGIEGKHFIEQSWDNVVGPNGQNIFLKYQKAIREIFGDFRRG